MKKTGRPTKYKKEYSDQAKKLCLLGAIDTDLADFFNVKEQTINNWKKDHSEFFEAIKRGKSQKDDQVEQSLFERATGYSHPDTHISNYQGKITKTEIIKHYPPEVVAIIFWLKNRRSDQWRDKHDINHTGDIIIKTDKDDEKL